MALVFFFFLSSLYYSFVVVHELTRFCVLLFVGFFVAEFDCVFLVCLGEDACKKLIESHKACLRKEGFNV